jgi:predicted amidohydrolase
MVVAQQEHGVSEMARFLPERPLWADLFLFPEGYLHSAHLPRACALARQHQKWVIAGMEDFRTPAKKYQAAVVINPQCQLVGEHRKTSLTPPEIEQGFLPGDSIQAIDTEYGKIGIAICYEIHFPEIARIYALQGAKCIFNPIGTGMWHEAQAQQWTHIAAACASENGVFVFGCSHYNDAIPIAFAYAPDGKCLVLSRELNRMVRVRFIPEEYPPSFDCSLEHRRPELYGDLTK